MSELPPVPSPSAELPRDPSRARIILLGLAGAIVSSGIAVAVALQFAKPDIPQEAFLRAPTPSDTPQGPPAVEGLRAEQGRWTGDPDSWRISLTWQPVDGAAGYLVSRDGRRLDEADTTEFLDDAVVPEGRYRYEVVAFDADRNLSEPARVRIRAEPLTNALARVQGRWLLKLEVESSSIDVGGGRVVITFAPNCAEGPCPVKWTFEDAGNSGTARNEGARYVGSGSGGFLTYDCGGGPVSSTVTLEFRIEKAHTVRKAWRATEISGTVTESVPSVSNCLSARNVWTFTGSAQG